jgi:hypothetical protein
MIFKLTAVLEELDSAEVHEEEGRRFRSIYVGNLLSLVPSGKYYTPFANSNVTEEEAEQDEAWFEAAEAELSPVHCYLESGEGSPTDLFITREEEE